MKQSRNQTRDTTADRVRRITAGRWRWEVVGAYAIPAMSPHWGDPEGLLGPPAERVIRNPPSRTTRVFRTQLPGIGENVFIKRYLLNGWQGFKSLFRSSKATRSFRIALELQRLGIPTAAPVAAGERRFAGWLRDAWLLTEEIPHARTWFECDRSLSQGPHRMPLIRALARCFAKLHDAGFSHSDANRNNLLIQFPPGVCAKLFLIDLDALVRRRVTRRQAVKDLCRLLARGPATPREQLWFLAEYCRQRKPTFSARDLLRRLTAQVNIPAARLRVGSLRWLVRSDLADAPIRRVLERPEAWLLDPNLFFKNSHNVTIARLPGMAKSGWVLRRLNYGKLSHRLRDFFRPSRARRAFRNGLRLERAGIATARVLAAGEVRRLRWPVHTYLLTEEIPGAVTLTALLERKHPQTQQVLQRLAVVLAQLHNHGFSHRDLKATNVLFDDQLRPHLIDLDGVRRVRFAARARAVADLARLARDIPFGATVSRRLAVWFLKAYCRRRRADDWHWWWRAITGRNRG